MVDLATAANVVAAATTGVHGSTGSIAYGLAPIAPGVGIGLIFCPALAAMAPPPEASGRIHQY